MYNRVCFFGTPGYFHKISVSFSGIGLNRGTFPFLGADRLDQLIYESPNRRLQPFVIKNAHVQRLIPIFHRHEADIFSFLYAVLRNQADAHTLRYQIQRDVIVIPKSHDKERQAQCLDIFDFELNQEECETIAAL